MAKKYPIFYNKNDIAFGKLDSNADILYLFDRIFNRQFTENLLNWYAQAPKGGNIWYGAFYQEKPIGMYGLLPMPFRINNQRYNGALCNNVGVVPEFQSGFRRINTTDSPNGKSLFQVLGEYALADSNFPIVVAASNLKATEGHKSIGWQSYGSLELLHGSIEQKTNQEISQKLKPDHFEFFPPSKKFQFYVEKDKNWMKWRYNKPEVEYKQSIFPDERHIIWKYYNEKKQVLETNDINLVFNLGNQVDIWQFQGSSNSNFLKSQGFIPILEHEFLIYRNQEISLDFSLNAFNFELGDNDVF